MIALLVAAALTLSPAPPSGPRSRPAAAEAEAALSHYEAGRLAEARAAIARAYMIEPWPDYLYARAQIERADGKCVAAREFYGLYLEANPPERGAELARAGILACPVPVPAPRPVPDTTPVKSWRKDPLGLTLAGLGGTAIVVGAGLYVGLARHRSDAQRATDHGEFARNYGRSRGFGIAAAAVMSVGATLALAGVIRLAIVKRHGRARSRGADASAR
jgi:hypothetical protein